MSEKTSKIPQFRQASQRDRRRSVARAAELEPDALERQLEAGGLDAATADQMVENAIGTFALPLGIALNFRINERDHLIPMAIEEPSVIAAASHAAKRIRQGGGFFAESDSPMLTAQIHVTGVRDMDSAKARVEAARAEILGIASRASRGLTERGGGAVDLEVRRIDEGVIVTHVHVDCCDAMGANAVNSVAEAVGPRVAELTGGELGLRILSNYCDRRLTRVRAEVPFAALGADPGDGASDHPDDGRRVARRIAEASRFADLDPYRAVTHNKGIMNGVDAVVIATGNDWRAVEAAAHAHACVSGAYRPLSAWRVDEDRGALVGQMILPLALGIVGGALRAHRGAQAALSIIGVKTGTELCHVVAAAGLATNLAALRALSTDGIQRGHMSLHHRTGGDPNTGARRK